MRTTATRTLDCCHTSSDPLSLVFDAHAPLSSTQLEGAPLGQASGWACTLAPILLFQVSQAAWALDAESTTMTSISSPWPGVELLQERAFDPAAPLRVESDCWVQLPSPLGSASVLSTTEPGSTLPV